MFCNILKTGSTSLTTDESGAVVSKQRYYPYGDVRDATGATPTDFGFTGQRRDASTGLMYYRARYYDSTLGRFVSADTIVPEPGNPQSLNRYAYTFNNPLKYADPSGHIPIVYYDPIMEYYLVGANLQLYGPGATPEVAQYYEEAIEGVWNRKNPHYGDNPVHFQINAFVKEPEYGDSFLALLGYEPPAAGEAKNLVYVEEGGVPPMIHPGVSTYFLNDDQPEEFDFCTPFYAEMDSFLLGHEAAHIFGIYVDRYDEETGRPLKVEWVDFITANPNGLPWPHAEEVDEVIRNARERGQIIPGLYLPMTLRED